MDTTSVWRATTASPGYAMLTGDLSTDVLVIGGGITGLTLACLLSRQGRSVVVLEADEIGSGGTGRSTGNLYETTSRGLRLIRSHWGDEGARQVLAQRRLALEFIEREAAALPEVGFRRCPLLLWSLSAEHQQEIDEEYEALSAAGASVSRSGDVPAFLPRPAGAALLLEGQAQFHPQAWVAHLARVAASQGTSIHEHSRVIDIDEKQRLATTATGSVRARELVMATHTPKGIRWVHAAMPVHREYAIALPLSPSADPGPGIFWGQGDEGLSVRTMGGDAGSYLVWVGQEHPVGEHNAKAALMALESVATRHAGTSMISHRWSAENFRGADELPYIGRDSTGCFMATGFATDGLTWGTVAAHLIVEQMNGHDSDFAKLCRPLRVSPIQSARGILEEVGVTVKALLRDYLTHRQEEDLATLAPGDSAIVDAGGDACAAWRSPEGELFAVSAVCTHMGCKVHWNSVETSWDCPCHGSRFRPDGTVIEGPALAPLTRKHPSQLAP